MGQRAIGLLYGCEAPILPDDDNGEAIYWLIDRWEKAKGITWDTKSGKPCIRHEHEGGRDLLGVWVAVGGSGEDGVPYFMEQCLQLGDVEATYAKSIAKAAKLWDRFAKWATKKEKLWLPPPVLWLTPCETA